jgi:hypothetical protein
MPPAFVPVGTRGEPKTHVHTASATATEKTCCCRGCVREGPTFTRPRHRPGVVCKSVIFEIMKDDVFRTTPRLIRESVHGFCGVDNVGSKTQ